MNERIDYSDYDEEYTHETLKAFVDEQWRKMSDEEKAWRCGRISGMVEPTFHEYVLYHTKPGDKVVLNEYTKEFKNIK